VTRALMIGRKTQIERKYMFGVSEGNFFTLLQTNQAENY
jgi:hypothetical protein